MFICMYVCTKSFLKTTTNSSCVCAHLANKADSDSDNMIKNMIFEKKIKKKMSYLFLQINSSYIHIENSYF